ncbi:MAG TPA: DAK2 domain-containing protein [Acidimicrobiales bacterium]|nr:DAK2 domain-containing protein [Acidimicrobiales bacterium]
MPVLERLDEDALRSVIVGYRDALRAHQQVLNGLNVYPVPDGDTGTNMALTLESVVAEIDGATGMQALCMAVAHGSLMGARGNSGVILSQILRGLSGAFAERDEVDAPALAEALTVASAAAYEAVMKPVEGTILTVVRETADAARAASAGSLVDMLAAASGAAQTSLARTPELLPVLAEAGVVDAGGAGFVLLLDVLLHVADGRPVPEPIAVAAPVTPDIQSGAAADDPRYEVMYFLEAPDDTVPGFKQRWSELGDSIVVVGGDGIWNCHIHTGNIGGSIEAGIEVGRPRQIRVTDLTDQVAELEAHRCGPAEHAVTAVVAVGLGPGIDKVFRELGAQQVVFGGQTMNPSTAEILRAVEACDADGVIVLPNNSNIVAVAEQVPPLAAVAVAVVPAKGIIEGVAAMLHYDAKADLDANVRSMTAGASDVVSGEVTRAVRDASTSAGPVAEGDWLGLRADDLVVVGADLAGAACNLLDRLVGDEHELVTVVEGRGATSDDTEQVQRWLAENRPAVTVEVHDWGHPLSAYLFSIE